MSRRTQNPPDQGAKPRGVRHAFRQARAWNDTEVDLLLMISAGVAVALPLAVGVVTHRIEDGMLAAFGALICSSAGKTGNLPQRAWDLVSAGVVGTAGIAAGLIIAKTHEVYPWILFTLAAAVIALVFTLRPSVARNGTLLLITAVIASSLGGPGMPLASPLEHVAMGAALNAVLALIAYLIAIWINPQTSRRAAKPRRSWSADFHRWSTGIRRLAGWHFAIRLTACVAVAVVLMRAVPGSHTTWILLTAILVVQRDHQAALARTVSRGAGTLVGVFAGAALLIAPSWVLVAAGGVIGSLREYLKVANYAAYAFVMTPLISALNGIVGTATDGLLVERIRDTLIGCAISVVIGYLPWRWLHEATDAGGVRRRDVS
jgi:uncharacterized membrane protein YccC